jgi:hypothetical protein
MIAPGGGTLRVMLEILACADWAVQVEDGTHAVHAELIAASLIRARAARLEITWDGEVIESSSIWFALGDLRSFERNGHSFLLKGRFKLGLLSSVRFDLYMDGVVVPETGMIEPAKTSPTPAGIQFVKEVSVLESAEIVGTELYPLDNRFGDQAFSTVRQVSRESTNELSVDTHGRLRGKIGFNVLSAIKTDIEAQVSRDTGHKIGEKVIESQTLTFSVGPKRSVLYEVVWKRRVRSGERLYLSGSEQVSVPYKIYYGLSCEVRSQQQAGGHNPSS